MKEFKFLYRRDDRIEKRWSKISRRWKDMINKKLKKYMKLVSRYVYKKDEERALLYVEMKE